MRKNEFKGFSLFNDILNDELRNRNRAVILANISENHTKDGKISPQGVGLVLGYFLEIPENERADVKDRFAKTMEERNFKIKE